RHEGYATHIVGKWHLGYNKWEYTPTYRGFDTFYGYYNAQEDHYDHTLLDILDFRDNKEPVTNIGGEFATFKYVERAEKIIQSHNASVPLFLYMAFQNVHAPLQAPKKYTDKYSFIKDRARRTYAGMVDSMDEAIGNITEAMKEAGLWEDTLVIFSTDNGGWHDFGGYNWPLRGEKFTLWEGGVRGVSFVHGNMLDRRGVKCEGLIHVTDWFPTLVKIAGGTVEGEATKLDGEDVWNAISKGEPARTEILLNIDLPKEEEGLNGMTSYEGIALRSGDMKLIMHVPNSSWFKPPELGGKPENFLQKTDPQPVKIALYNITADPEEREDLSSKFVDVVKKLTDRINQLQAGVVPALYGPPDIKAVVKALEEGVWTPWQD
ncbi:PREDICTED: arylsulfatase B-like, partial [Acropora digitifera]|uniref:arylsulfatase B-like n=1 Tax=Acropora digitifera TaxID=70779 RepID=UPI00077B026E